MATDISTSTLRTLSRDAAEAGDQATVDDCETLLVARGSYCPPSGYPADYVAQIDEARIRIAKMLDARAMVDGQPAKEGER